ncbi:unnamed protein product [Amoebophrya sp. A25]|nr:unnamed protein product [Amoebophrya sp. A25]|eukprot:GSA25T00009067001.1
MAVKLSIPGGQHLLFLYLVVGFFFGGTLLCYGRIGLGISLETQNDFLMDGGPLESFVVSPGPGGPSITPCEAGCTFLQDSSSCACDKKTEERSTATTTAKTTGAEAEAKHGARGGGASGASTVAAAASGASTAASVAGSGGASAAAAAKSEAKPAPSSVVQAQANELRKMILGGKDPAKTTIVFLSAGNDLDNEREDATNMKTKIMNALIKKSAEMAKTEKYRFVTGGASHWQHVFATGMSGMGQTTHNFPDLDRDFISPNGVLVQRKANDVPPPAAFPPPQGENELTHMKELTLREVKEQPDYYKELFIELVADVYLVFKGGPKAPAEVFDAYRRGDLVVPVLFSGGMSSPKSTSQISEGAGLLPEPIFNRAKEWQKYDLCAPDKAEPEAIADAVWGQIEERRVEAKEVRKIILGDKRPAEAAIVFLVAGNNRNNEGKDATNIKTKMMNALIEKSAEMAGTGKYIFVTGGASHWQHVFATGMSGKGQTTHNFADHNGDFISSKDVLDADGVKKSDAAFPPARAGAEGTHMLPLKVKATGTDKNLLTGLVADVYVVFQGGQAAPAEVAPAHEKGALVVPVLCSGGTSAPGGENGAALPEDIYNNAKTWQLEQDGDLCAPGEEDPKAIADAVWGQVAGNMEEKELASKFMKKHNTERRVVIAVLGGDFPAAAHDTEGKERNFLETVVPAVAEKVVGLVGDKVLFVTGGVSDTQRLFGQGVAKAKSEVSLYNLKGEPVTCQAAPLEGDWKGNAWGVPYPHNDPKDSRKAKLTGLLGDVVITIGGGDVVIEEAKLAVNEAKQVVPLIATGVPFPEEALERPEFVAEDLWNGLATKIDGAEQKYAENAAEVIRAAVDEARV